MKPKIALIDYDMGNLRSVAKSLEKVGCQVDWVCAPFKLEQYDGLVLPGVGAFEVAVKNLKARKLLKPIANWIAEDKPFLGICLGYQMLFETSQEARSSLKALGVFKGKSRLLPAKGKIKVPHIGWNQIQIENRHPAVKGIRQNSYFYFDHSYVPVPQDKSIVCTTTDYGISFASSVQKGQLFACQFHPEKSGEVGLKLLQNFTQLCQKSSARAV